MRWLESPRVYGQALDRRAAVWLHRASAQPQVLRLLSTCSRLADGPLWVFVMLLLPFIDGDEGSLWARRIALLGAVNLGVYWALKRTTRRLRPFEGCPGIRARARVPDHFSFPSGHTLHATAFAMLLSAYHVALAPWLWSFALLVGMSRVVLGLHYPSDVVAGGLIGGGTAILLLLG